MKNINNKKLALIIWEIDENNEENAVIYSGTTKLYKNDLFLHRGKGYKKVKIMKDWWPRIKKMNKDTVLFHLKEAKDELDRTIKKLQQ